MTLPTKKVFISYSWTTPKHEDWVLELAIRLRSNNVDVVLDKWDLNEGDDKFHFMEQSVSSEEIEKVLIILDEGYAKKANGRAGGVGTETLIISPKLYGQVMQDKFNLLLQRWISMVKRFCRFIWRAGYILTCQPKNCFIRIMKLYCAGSLTAPAL